MLALSALVSWGCAVRIPARSAPIETPPAAARTLSSIRWPERDTSKLDQIVADTPDIIRLYRSGPDLPPETPDRVRRAVERPLASVRFNERLGVGVLRELANRDRPAGAPGNALRFVSYSTYPIQPEDERGNPWRWFLRSQAGVGEGFPRVINEEQVLSVLGSGLRMQVIDPPDGVARRGLVVHLHGLGSRRYEAPVMDAIRNDGWTILQVSTPRVWFYKPVRFSVRNHAEIDPVAREIAGLIDDQLAEPAYAVEAALAYLRTARPDVATRPCVLVGFSAGALFGPAVVARQPDAFDGAVLIGGGTNLLRISQTSDLTNGGLQIDWSIASDRDRYGDELADAYARHAQLDPLKTSVALHGKPTLLVLAAVDSTVPASTAGSLHRTNPTAERIVLPVGHRLMFWLLDGQSRSITEWLRSVGSR